MNRRTNDPKGRARYAAIQSAMIAQTLEFGRAGHITGLEQKPDNLRTGIDKPDLYDPKINRSYGELVEHYRTLVDPARVRKPRDKAQVEWPRGRSRRIGHSGPRSSPIIDTTISS